MRASFAFLTVCMLAVVSSPQLSMAQSKPVNEDAWISFKKSAANSHQSGAASGHDNECPVAAKCASLHRMVISCDYTDISVSCGVCLPGYVMVGSDVSKKCLANESNESEVVDTVVGIDKAQSLSQRSTNEDVDKKEDGPVNADVGMSDKIFYSIIALSCAVAILAVVIAMFCYCRYRRKKFEDEQYNSPYYYYRPPSYYKHPGEPPHFSGDRKLAQSAQMYHYQHQRQQIIAMEESGQEDDGMRDVDEDDYDEEDSSNGTDSKKQSPRSSGRGTATDMTVYEVPGLAAADMEVHNPFFMQTVPDDSSNKSISSPPTNK